MTSPTPPRYYVPIGQHVAPRHPQAGNTTLQRLLWDHTEEVVKKYSV